MCRLAPTVVVVVALAGCSMPAIEPVDTMFDGESGGCGNLIVYRFNDAKTLAVRVSVDEQRFTLSDEPTTFELDSADRNAVRVEILRFSGPADSYFCDDVEGNDPDVIARWQAVSGKLTVVRQEGAPPRRVANATHSVTVELQDVTLENSGSGATCRLGSVSIPNVWVGWLAG